MAKKYKRISMATDKVKIGTVQVIANEYDTGFIQATYVAKKEHPGRFAILITTNDKRTFNRIVKHTGAHNG